MFAASAATLAFGQAAPDTVETQQEAPVEQQEQAPVEEAAPAPAEEEAAPAPVEEEAAPAPVEEEAAPAPVEEEVAPVEEEVTPAPVEEEESEPSKFDEITSEMTDFSKLSCYFIDDWNIFDLRKLQKTDGDYRFGSYTFNFCQFVETNCDGSEGTTFAKHTFGVGAVDKCQEYTDDTIIPAKVETVNGDDSSLIHVKYLQESDNVCEADSTRNYAWEVEVFCNNDFVDEPKFKMVQSGDDLCTGHLEVQHESGCPVISGAGFFAFLTANPWILSIIYFIISVALMLRGMVIFPYAVAVLVGIFGLSVFALTGSWWLIGFGFIVIVIGMTYCLYKLTTKTLMKISSLSLGGVAGFFVGSMIYSLFIFGEDTDGFGSFWITLAVTVAVFMTIAWFFLAPFVLYATSIIGAYLFARAIAMLTGDNGLPSPLSLYEMTEAGDSGVEVTWWAFCLYVAGIITLSVLSIIYQRKRSDDIKHLQDVYSRSD